jgi:hypothetical protein
MLARLPMPASEPRQAEVHQVGMTARIKHEIARLDIAVDDPQCMSAMERARQLDGYLGGLIPFFRGHFAAGRSTRVIELVVVISCSIERS